MGLQLGTWRSLLGVGLGVPTWNFDPALITFTEKMAKRTAPGPFAAAPIVQGKFDGSGTPDTIAIPTGSAISGFFHPNIDLNQGSIVVWWIPEKSNNPLQSNDEYFFQPDFDFYATYEHNNGRVRFFVGGQNCTKSLLSVAGTTYCIVFRWDAQNKLDGTNYGCISINDVHAFGMPSQPTISAPINPYNFGAHRGSATPSNSILEGYSVYRRVLYDGTYGIDAVNGDEINLISAGVKPEEITGADDICFQLPTDGSTGELATGTGEAWSWPWADNELTNWHLQDDTAGAPDNWTAYNSPTLADAETANILFGTRSQKVSVDGQFEGIYQDISVSAGEDYCISAWVKDNGANQGVLIEAYDQTGSALIVAVNSTDSGAWENLTTCFEIPAGCSTVRVSIISLDNDTYDFYIAQVQVLPNLVDNGGMEGVYDDESGGGGGTIDVAPGWANYNCETDGTDTLDESADAHSGSKSQQINVTVDNEGIIGDNNSFTQYKWHVVTVWIKGTSGDVRISDSQAGAFFSEVIVAPAAAWTRYSFVTYATLARKLRVTANAGAANFLVDDVSVIVLDDVSITVTPASEANSTEDGGIRVDGLDTALSAPVTVTASKGKLNFYITKRHAAADVAKLGETTPYELHWYEDANNYLYIYWSAANTLDVKYNAQGAGEQTGQVDMTGAWAAGARKLVTLEWGGSSCKLDIDSVNKITIAQPASFTAMTANFYFGSDKDGVNQSDSVYGATS